jgi:hypothetical protein
MKNLKKDQSERTKSTQRVSRHALLPKTHGAAAVVIVPDLSEFNRRYTVSSLPVEPESILANEKPVDYVQVLLDGKDRIESELLVAKVKAAKKVQKS